MRQFAFFAALVNACAADGIAVFPRSGSPRFEAPRVRIAGNLV